MKTLALLLILSACAGVRKEDVESWNGQPVTKLDTHWLFLTMEMDKRISSDGTETRNYKNKGNVETRWLCPFGNCKAVTSQDECNNLFYIKDGVVIEYKPVGKCVTDETVRPTITDSDTALPRWE